MPKRSRGAYRMERAPGVMIWKQRQGPGDSVSLLTLRDRRIKGKTEKDAWKAGLLGTAQSNKEVEGANRELVSVRVFADHRRTIPQGTVEVRERQRVGGKYRA